MTLKADLIRSGYLPENLPPAYNTVAVETFFAANPPAGYLAQPGGTAMRAAVYSASKRGLSRRPFSAVHPVTAYDLAKFVEDNIAHFEAAFAGNKSSFSKPLHTPSGPRSVEIASHSELEAQRLSRLAGYRFVAKTDVSRFYHSAYTHSVPWAFHGKAEAKKDRKVDSAAIFFNRLDFILRQGQDGQTVGIPVGPDASRFIAELIAAAVDREFVQRCDVGSYAFVRHVDDVWIGAHTHADAERALWRYREALREFELDINETKTRIYAENFRFTDAWPFDVTTRLEAAIAAPAHRRDERLRAALEFAFALSVSEADDGIIKYVIRQIDRAEIDWGAWGTLEPFLMRAAVHFGHSLDYVVRVLVWRSLVRGDLDHDRWTPLLSSVLDRQGRLGNDSEVCWSLYAAMRLGIPISSEIANNIINNCGALSAVALLNCVEVGLLDAGLFNQAFEQVAQESGNGTQWPLFLEWMTRQWPRHAEVKDRCANEVILKMAEAGVTLFDPGQLTRVFAGIEQGHFSEVGSAIEGRVSMYDDVDVDEFNNLDEDEFTNVDM